MTKSKAEQAISRQKLERKEMEEKLALLQEQMRRYKTRKIYRMYPEDGPLCRALYKKHMLFLAMGAKYNERAAVAANRVGKCLTGDTVIQTTKGSRVLRELYESQELFEVWAYTGETLVTAKASPVFKKEGLHNCYRMVMSDGQTVGMADDHRVLTSKGWMFAHDLFQSLVNNPRQCVVYRLLSSLAFDLSMFQPDGQHLSQRPQGFLGHCSIGTRPCGELFRMVTGIFRFFAPRPDDVQLHTQILSCSDDLGDTDNGTRRQSEHRLSNQCAFHRCVDRFFEFLGRVSCTVGLWCLDLRRIFRPLATAVTLHLRSVSAKLLGQLGFFSSLDSSLVKVDDNKVISVSFIGRNEVFDFEVKDFHNYVAGGLIHHNTEGMGAYELVLHLTGEYPPWWEGRRFSHAVKAWAAGTTNQKTKEILQDKLIGPLTDIGTGLIPGDLLLDYKKKASSVPDVVETILVKHVPTGDVSVLVLKSFEQGRASFEGTEQDVILLDEEPPEDVYTECVIRTMTTNGIIMLTFTPLQGVSDVVKKFMPGGVPKEGEVDGRFLVTATWDDAPHLSEADKKRLWLTLPPHQRDARSKGIPSMGSGAIYPILESDVTVDDFPIPAHWPRGYAMDVGWSCTAALWGAQDPETGIVYVTSNYKRGMAEPEVHVAAIKARGDWMFGASDPAARIGSQKDGDNLLDNYKSLGLKLVKADNSVETGLFDVWTLFSTGKLKVFRSCTSFFEEFRLYRRDEKGRIVKEDDHLMDCLRYLIRTGVKLFRVMPLKQFMTHHDQATSHYDMLRHGL